jgi:hypothetical protein
MFVIIALIVIQAIINIILICRSVILIKRFSQLSKIVETQSSTITEIVSAIEELVYRP